MEVIIFKNTTVKTKNVAAYQILLQHVSKETRYILWFFIHSLKSRL